MFHWINRGKNDRCSLIWLWNSEILKLKSLKVHFNFSNKLIDNDYYGSKQSWNLNYLLFFSQVPKSGAEYAYLFETFSKMHKFWGPLPAFICNWVYVMVLRPAEVAILILICVTYAFEPVRHQIKLDSMDESDKQNLYKMLAAATLCKILWIFCNNS